MYTLLTPDSSPLQFQIETSGTTEILTRNSVPDTLYTLFLFFCPGDESSLRIRPPSWSFNFRYLGTTYSPTGVSHTSTNTQFLRLECLVRTTCDPEGGPSRVEIVVVTVETVTTILYRRSLYPGRTLSGGDDRRSLPRPKVCDLVLTTAGRTLLLPRRPGTLDLVSGGPW